MPIDSNYSPALTPYYELNMPGESVPLFDGLIDGLTDSRISGSVELQFSPRMGIRWNVNNAQWHSLEPKQLLLHRTTGPTDLDVVPNTIGSGWSNGTEFGNADAPLTRIIAHWVNLPDIHGDGLVSLNPNGEINSWPGRWVTEIQGWKLTLDIRHDHKNVWAVACESGQYLMTHVMELRRSNGESFSASEATQVLEALHVGLSFAVGRWVAPILAVGEQSAGKVIWEEWRAPHCDPPRKRASGWWYQADLESLREFLDIAISTFCDSSRRWPIRLGMMLAIEAIKDHSFVEQRIMSAFSGLEQATWLYLVHAGTLEQGAFERRGIAKNIRDSIQAANIATKIDPAKTPKLDQFAQSESIRQGRNLDAPEIAAWIRNRLVHPDARLERIYQTPGLMTEAWLLTRHWLALLILHQCQYTGKYRDLDTATGFDSQTEPVPWST